MILLLELRYRDAHRSFLPDGHAWWRRDADGKILPGWEEGGYLQLAVSNPEFRDHVAKRAEAAVASGVVDGIMLDWWRDDEDRLSLVKDIRSRIGDDTLILANANDLTTPRTAPFINGYFMECYRSQTAADWNRIATTLVWAEGNLRPPRINCLETNRATEISFSRSEACPGRVGGTAPLPRRRCRKGCSPIARCGDSRRSVAVWILSWSCMGDREHLRERPGAMSRDTPPSGPLRVALLAGVAYFCCMSVAHFWGLKYPLLFVYYDVPFHAYQDKIIAFAVVAYICLFANAAMHRTGVLAAVMALGVTVLGLSAVNLSDALAEVLDGRSTRAYWIQTALLAGYLVVLLGLYGVDMKAAQTRQ